MNYRSQQIHFELSQEIDKRISHDSPTKYDIDFYLRKISRLENDLTLAQDQLSKARVRLRRAEDFQIKYDILLKQCSSFQVELQKREKECNGLRSEVEIMRGGLEDKKYQGDNWENERKVLSEQIQVLRTKCEELQERKSHENVTIREKVDTQLKNQVESVKRDFVERQQQLTTQVRHLKRIINEKETVETVVNNKVQKIRTEKDKQILRLSQLIQNKKQETTQIVRQKNEEIEKLRQKFETLFNFEIQNLRRNLDDQDEVFNIEINGLRELLGLKNDEIGRLLRQLRQQSEDHEKERQLLLKQIASLKDKIYTIQRQNELELYNVKQRLSKIHSLEIQTLQKQYNQIVANLRSEITNLQKILKQKDNIIDSQRKDIERIRQELLDRLKERQARITQLQQRIKQTGDMNAAETKNLHQSFHKIETQKQNITTDYQANVGFLNQQIAKLTSNNDIKNNQIKMLHEQIALIKKQNADYIKQIQDQWREEREQREIQRERQRQKRQKLQQQMRLRDRQWRGKQRQLQRARQKQQREKTKIKYICEELQRDIERLNLYIKNLDEGLKKQMKKNQLSTLDNGGVRRELTSELDRQKSDLQAIKRMQVDQIKKRYEIQLTRLTNQNQKFNTDLLKKTLAYQQLEGQFKNLEHINKNIDKINKQKLIEYQKKMATLNNEILLTQNLYKSFMQAKARQKQNSPPQTSF